MVVHFSLKAKVKLEVDDTLKEIGTINVKEEHRKRKWDWKSEN